MLNKQREVEVFQFSYLYDPDADDIQNLVSSSLSKRYSSGEIFKEIDQ